MKTRWKFGHRNIWELVSYALPTLLSRGSNFFLLPVYTRLLTPADFGLVNVTLVVVGLLRLAVLPGLEGVYLRYAFGGYSPEKLSVQPEFGNIVRVHLLIALGVIPLCIPLT